MSSGFENGQVHFASATPQELRKWNHLSELMNQFHESFKYEFNRLYELSDGSFSRAGMSLVHYLNMARSLNHHLTMHHTIEEHQFFPKLGARMPQFAEKSNGQHLQSHKSIHDGLESMIKLVDKWSRTPNSYSPTEMKACLNGFKGVLYSHLDEEVADLRGENLSKYFTLREVESILDH